MCYPDVEPKHHRNLDLKKEESYKFKFRALTVFSGIVPNFYIFSSVHKPSCIILSVLGFMVVLAYYKFCL